MTPLVTAKPYLEIIRDFSENSGKYANLPLLAFDPLAGPKLPFTRIMGLTMLQPITGYHADDEGHWVAQLACGHNQHVRHDPPWMNHPWVVDRVGRDEMLGHELRCKKCDERAPADQRPEVWSD